MKDQERTALQAELRKYLESGIDPWADFRQLDAYLYRSRLSEPAEKEEFRELCEKLFGWIGLNTSKQENTDAIRETYVCNGTGSELPSIAGFQRLFDKVNDPAPSVLYLRGPRGAGKTAALNYFFTTKSDALSKQGFTYFRCDARKLQEVDRHIDSLTQSLRGDGDAKGAKGGNSGISLSEYIDAHNIYVALMHAQHDRWLECFSISAVAPLDQRLGKFAAYLDENSCHDECEIWKGIVAEFLAEAVADKDRPA